MEDVRDRLRDLTARSGLGEVPPHLLAAGLAICAVVVVGALWYWWTSSHVEPGPASDAVVLEGSGVSGAVPKQEARTEDAASAPSTATVCVHVVGAVHRPGLYRLSHEARVADAIASAGGLLGSAEERAVNLARAIVDGEQIVVVTRDEYASGSTGGAAAAAGGSSNGDGVAATASGAAAPIDINSADAATLDTLPGIGPATAARIIADREANGPFASPEDLGRVSGIGEKKLETLQNLIVAR